MFVSVKLFQYVVDTHTHINTRQNKHSYTYAVVHTNTGVPRTDDFTRHQSCDRNNNNSCLNVFHYYYLNHLIRLRYLVIVSLCSVFLVASLILLSMRLHH